MTSTGDLKPCLCYEQRWALKPALRMENPEKRWKITDEDLRNREKWDLYEHAADEMIMRTSTAYAPWVIVEGNDKYYARIKVLKTVTDAIEKRLKER